MTKLRKTDDVVLVAPPALEPMTPFGIVTPGIRRPHGATPLSFESPNSRRSRVLLQVGSVGDGQTDPTQETLDGLPNGLAQLDLLGALQLWTGATMSEAYNADIPSVRPGMPNFMDPQVQLLVVQYQKAAALRDEAKALATELTPLVWESTQKGQHKLRSSANADDIQNWHAAIKATERFTQEAQTLGQEILAMHKSAPGQLVTAKDFYELATKQGNQPAESRPAFAAHLLARLARDEASEVTQEAPIQKAGDGRTTKAAMHYRAGTPGQHCATCTMFRTPNGCTYVRGTIQPDATCDAYEASTSKALAGIQARLEKRQFDAGVGGGVDRDALAQKDFAGPHRSYPVVSPKDVADAAKLVGHAKDPKAVKRRITAIARKKGRRFVERLPESWQDAGAAGQRAQTIAKALAAHGTMQHPMEMPYHQGRPAYDAVPEGAVVRVVVNDPASPVHGRPVLLKKTPHGFRLVDAADE